MVPSTLVVPRDGEGAGEKRSLYWAMRRPAPTTLCTPGRYEHAAPPAWPFPVMLARVVPDCAISAACHPYPAELLGQARRPLNYSVVESDELRFAGPFDRYSMNFSTYSSMVNRSQYNRSPPASAPMRAHDQLSEVDV